MDPSFTGGESLARRVYNRAHLAGEFRLRSGQISDEYFDKYLLESDPALLREISEALVALLPAKVDALAGLELGGVPLAVAMSAACGLPVLFVRKQVKAYGTRRLAEGGEVDGQRLILVEDVISSAGQAIQSAGELRNRGAEIELVLCVIDRQAGGRERLAENGIELRSLFTMNELKIAAEGEAPGGDS